MMLRWLFPKLSVFPAATLIAFSAVFLLGLGAVSMLSSPTKMLGDLAFITVALGAVPGFIWLTATERLDWRAALTMWCCAAPGLGFLIFLAVVLALPKPPPEPASFSEGAGIFGMGEIGETAFVAGIMALAGLWLSEARGARE